MGPVEAQPQKGEGARNRRQSCFFVKVVQTEGAGTVVREPACVPGSEPRLRLEDERKLPGVQSPAASGCADRRLMPRLTGEPARSRRRTE